METVQAQARYQRYCYGWAFFGQKNREFVMLEEAIRQKTKKMVKKLSDTMVSDVEKTLLTETDVAFKALTEQLPNMIFIHKGGHIVYVNKKSEELMGYTKTELLSPDFDFMQLIAPESIEALAKNFRLHMKGL